MSEYICVTNRKLCKENFLDRIEKIAACHPRAIILREKDLTQPEYEKLAKDVLKICKKNDVICIIHSFPEVALKSDYKALHVPLEQLRLINKEERQKFTLLGTSCHSVEDAVEAQKLGCHYLVAGHVFDTDCKKGIPGRGLTFLEKVVENVSIPVYAIGGITRENYPCVYETGVKGACIMSGFMSCENVKEYFG